MIVEFVAVGTELLLGQIENSNAGQIARRLAAEGFECATERAERASWPTGWDPVDECATERAVGAFWPTRSLREVAGGSRSSAAYRVHPHSYRLPVEGKLHHLIALH